MSQFKPVQVFGFIMSFAYVFFGMMILMTPFLNSLIEDVQYRKIFGAAVAAYGLIRVGFFLRQIIRKS